MHLSTCVDQIQDILLTSPSHGLGDWPLAGLFRTGLKTIQKHRGDYDAIIDDHNPFLQEFSHYAQCGVQDDGDWFSLFECMVIFIRMRQMARRHGKLSPEERAILEYFEGCEEWRPQDDKLVCSWYWHRIPFGEM